LDEPWWLTRWVQTLNSGRGGHGIFPARAKPRPYHHGDLRTAVLAVAEKILEQEGLDALTLRAVARAVGVSHTAPKNHFGDLEGLLSELAGLGYRRFGESLATAMDAAPRARMRAMGRAYVGFARAHPGLFILMFRGERLDMTRPVLRDAVDSARAALRNAAMSSAPVTPQTPLQITARATASWALVHGFAMLLLDGRLQNTIASLWARMCCWRRCLTQPGSRVDAAQGACSYIAPVRNGLVIRSWPMLEPGPWPQMKPTSSPSGSSFVVIDSISVA
jgi:AcrR family transcriptional regulator